MTTGHSEDFTQVLARQKQELAAIKKTLDEQGALLAKLKDDYEKIGFKPGENASLNDLPKEYLDQYLAFERELTIINDLLAPPRPKGKGPAIGRRITI